MRLLVTGGMGFIGSNFIRRTLADHADFNVVNLDKLTYGSNPANLRDLENTENYRFVKGDICDETLVKSMTKDIDAIINFAAESHVDRSIANPQAFVESNTRGVLTLLEACRQRDLKYLQISTDEVYGSTPESRPFLETDRLAPSSPYSASKASADMLVNAYHRTYEALDLVLSMGRPGEIYNIAGGNQVENVEIVKRILNIMGKGNSLISHGEDRPGHDLRYRLDASKIERELGWKPKHRFEEGLTNTVKWYLENESWWRPLIDDKILSPTPWKETW